MIARLVLRHEILQCLTKPLLITVVTVSLVLNILAFKMVQNEGTSLLDGFGAVPAQFVFLMPLILILLLGKAGSRCRSWEAGLPLAARELWWAHFLALASACLLLILVSGVTFAGFGILNASLIGRAFFNLADVFRLMARPAAVSLTAAGLTTMIIVYAVINIGMVTALLPVMGLPLPFVSYGGSSMFFSSIAIGVLLNISSQTDLHPRIAATADGVRPMEPSKPAVGKVY